MSDFQESLNNKPKKSKYNEPILEETKEKKINKKKDEIDCYVPENVTDVDGLDYIIENS